MRTFLLMIALTACQTTEPCGAPDAKCVPMPEADATAQPAEAAAELKTPNAPRSDIKAPGNLPVLTTSELAAEDAVRTQCFASCADGDEGCLEACRAATPIRQVEVVSDPMPAPPE